MASQIEQGIASLDVSVVSGLLVIGMKTWWVFSVSWAYMGEEW